jgi:hypothetical protein
MEKEFVPYELQLEIENLGLYEPCFGVYGKSEKKLFLIHKEVFDEVDKKHFIKAYTYQQAFRWFREKYGIIGYCYIPNETGYWGHSFENKAKYDTYEKAELECLKKLIEIVKNSRL